MVGTAGVRHECRGDDGRRTVTKTEVIMPADCSGHTVRVERAETADEVAAALAIRHRVFTGEQGIDPAADRDGRDEASTHLLAIAEADDHREATSLTAFGDSAITDDPPRAVETGDPSQAVGPDERAVGTIRVREDGREIWGERLAVLEPYRGQGYGSSLVESLVTRAGERDVDRIHAHVQAPSVPFCRSHGFREIGERFEEVGREHAEMVHDLDDVEPR